MKQTMSFAAETLQQLHQSAADFGWRVLDSRSGVPRTRPFPMNLPSATLNVAEAPSLEARTYAKVDRRLLPFLFLCYILAYLDRVNVGFAKLQMLQDLSLSDVAFGTGAGIFFVGYFLFEVPSNLLLKKFGARTWIARIMVSWGILSSAMMWVKSEWAFYAVRFLLGVAEAGFFPGIIFYLTLWYPSRLRSTRTAWFVSAIAVSGVVGSPVSGLIMENLPSSAWLAGLAVSGGGSLPSGRHLGLVYRQRHRPG
jgi:MFS family permease